MDTEKIIEGARDYDPSKVTREMLQEELMDNEGLLKAVDAQIEYFQKMIESPDPVMVQQDPNMISDLKGRLEKAVEGKQRLDAEKERIEKERIEKELSAK